MVDRQDRGQAQYDAVIAAAQNEFEHYGYDGARIQRIADLAGVSKPNLLYYFPSKEALYQSVLSIAIEHWTDMFTVSIQDDPEASLNSYIEAKIDFSAQHPQSARIFTNEVLAGLPHIRTYIETDAKSWLDKQVALIESWQKAGKIKNINAEHIVIAIWGMTQHLADYQSQLEAFKGGALSDEDYKAYKASFKAIILKGVLAE